MIKNGSAKRIKSGTLHMKNDGYFIGGFGLEKRCD
jgi:hypothetical protein